MLCLALTGLFAAKAGKTSEKSNGKQKSELKVTVSASVVKVSTTSFFLLDRIYTSSCGTWTVSGPESLLTADQEQDYCNQACVNCWTTWSWDGTTLTGH